MLDESVYLYLRIKYSSVFSAEGKWKCPDSNCKYELIEALILLFSSMLINSLSSSIVLWLNKSFL